MSRKSFESATSDEARQGLLDNRDENRKSKRHRVRKRSKRLNELKRQRAKHRVNKQQKWLKRWSRLVRDYWAGVRDDHPGSFN